MNDPILDDTILTDAVPGTQAVAPSPPPAATPEPTPDEAAGQRYVDAIDELVNDAVEHKHVVALVDALAWSIARIMVGYGLPAAGDVLKRIGAYVGEMSERRRAQEEAEQAKKEGRPVH